MRSRLLLQYCLLQTFLAAISIPFLPGSAWSLPISHAADLDVKPQSKGVDVSGISHQKIKSTLDAPSSAQTSASPPGTPTLQRSDVASQIPTLTPQTPNPKSQIPNSDAPLDLDPKLIQSSPVLQRWLQHVPDVLADIKRDPGFRTRLRLGYSQFPSTKQAGGINIGIEDVFVGRSGLTLSGNYQTTFNGKREAWGGDLRYYIRPLGSVINVAPVVGYRHLETTRYSTDGVHVGLRLLLVPSRTGAADLSVTQSWVAPYGEAEVGLTTLTFGYALTHSLRLSTDLQKQNSRFRSDSSVSVGLEWLF